MQLIQFNVSFNRYLHPFILIRSFVCVCVCVCARKITLRIFTMHVHGEQHEKTYASCTLLNISQWLRMMPWCQSLVLNHGLFHCLKDGSGYSYDSWNYNRRYHRYDRIHKNLAITKGHRSRVSCAHKKSRAYVGLIITPWPWNLG